MIALAMLVDYLVSTLSNVLHDTFRKGTNVLALLNKVASDVLDLTEFLHCEISTSAKSEDAPR